MNFDQEENQRLQDRFDAFVKTKRPNFAQDIHSTKILVTGFGLFKGIESNITTTLTHALANRDFFKQSQDLTKTAFFSPSLKVPRGVVLAEHGVDVAHRRVFISGFEFEFLILGIDVQWDFASAVIAHEVTRTQPDALLMLGQGKDKIILENGALNQSSKLSGFDQFGINFEANTTNSKELFPGAPSELPMSWRNEFIADEIRPLAEELDFEVEAASAPRPTNTYICNQVSYSSLYQAKGQELNFAGGGIKVESPSRAPKSIGFLHLPKRERMDHLELALWLELITKVSFHMLPDLSAEASGG